MPDGKSRGSGGLLDAFTTIDEDLREIRVLLQQISKSVEGGVSASGSQSSGSTGGGPIVDSNGGGGAGFPQDQPEPLVERTKVIEDSDIPKELVPIQSSILRNVRMARNGEVDMEKLPVGLVGTASEDISSGSTGKAFFTISGTNYSVDVEASSEISALQKVIIIDEDGKVSPVDSDDDGSGISIVGSGRKTSRTSKSGKDNAAELDLGRAGVRSEVDIHYNVKSSQGPLTFEVKVDGGDWRQFDQISQTDLSNDNKDIYQMDTTYRYVRAYVGDAYTDDQLNNIEVVASGI